MRPKPNEAPLKRDRTLSPSMSLEWFDHGYWYARSAEFMHKPLIELLVWMRVPGDTLFSIGALLITWFVVSQWIAPRIEAKKP